MLHSTIVDRTRGCILGGAVGDAMGGAFEGEVGPVEVGDHRHWSISDDTQLTLATCESIIELSGAVEPEHIAGRFVQWFRDRRISGMGSSTLKALRDLDAGLHWALAGAKGEMAAGNGAAMRIAPLSFHLDPTRAKARQVIRDVCRITHHNEEAYAGALAVALAIRYLALDVTEPRTLFDAVLQHLPDSRVRDRILELNKLSDERSVAEVGIEFGSSGYVVESVPVAIYAARFVDRLPFNEVIRNAIEAGGDTDTVASITGQIAGAWIGAEQIPRALIDSIPGVQSIERIADQFAQTMQSS
jgi:ADP-ribosylglycohydrolase